MGDQTGRGLGVAAADFDGDGLTDLFVANDAGANFLYRNLGNGRFEEVAMLQNVALGAGGKAQANMGLAVGDYDEDGDLDIGVSTFTDEPYTLYRNDGVTFTDVSSEAGIAAPTLSRLGFGDGFFDPTNAGRLDLFFANGHVYPNVALQRSSYSYAEANQLFLNNGAGGFVESPASLPAEDIKVHRGACFGDFNNDGRVDLLITANNGHPTLLRNDSPAGNWLLLRLSAASGCATPVGARCTATIGERRRMRVLLGGGSYGGESDSRVHFGLGQASKVDRLEILWPSGSRQTLTDIRANQILAVREEHQAPGPVREGAR
jgi:hypothetical protein